MTSPFIGSIVLFAGKFAPKGWAFCNGQLLEVANNTALFSLIGNCYGGDGQINFSLPNLQGRVPLHVGISHSGSVFHLGQEGGQEKTVLTTAQLANHSHAMLVSSSVATTSNPVNGFLSVANSSIESGETIYANIYTGSSDLIDNEDMITPVGKNEPVSNLQPYLGLNFIIALDGVYPSK